MAGARRPRRPGSERAGPSPSPRPQACASCTRGARRASLLPRTPPGGADSPAAPAQSAAATPREAGPGGAPGAFKSRVPDLQVRTCARCGGGGNICPRAPTRRAPEGGWTGPGPLSLHRPPPRPLPGSPFHPPPHLPKLFPGLGLKGAATSHEASQSQSLSTHTTQSCGKKNLVPSLSSRWHSRVQASSGLPDGAGGHPPPSDTWSPEDTPSPSHLVLTLSSPCGPFPLPTPPPLAGPGSSTSNSCPCRRRPDPWKEN